MITMTHADSNLLMSTHSHKADVFNNKLECMIRWSKSLIKDTLHNCDNVKTIIMFTCKQIINLRSKKLLHKQSATGVNCLHVIVYLNTRD